jgi:hypothetical protein
VEGQVVAATPTPADSTPKNAPADIPPPSGDKPTFKKPSP